jgi:hypothetical protein
MSSSVFSSTFFNLELRKQPRNTTITDFNKDNAYKKILNFLLKIIYYLTLLIL